MGPGKQTFILLILFLCIFILLTVALHQVLQNNSLGFDYMFYWHAGRALFKEGISPYSQEVTQRIQLAAYGRLAEPGEYPYPFPYPLPILFIPLPLYFLDYDWSQAAWMAFCLLAVISLGLLAFPRSPKWLILTLPLIYHIYFTLIVGNYALLFGVLLILIFYSLFFKEKETGWIDIFSGVALAWMTNKPQMVWLFIVLILACAWRKRRLRLIYGFGGGLAGLHLASLLLQPGWIGQWLNTTRVYSQGSAHSPTLSTYLSFIFPTSVSFIASIVLAVLLLAVTAYLFARWWQNRLDSLLLIAWCALVISLLDVSSLSPDRIGLIVPFFLWAVMEKPSGKLKLVWAAGILLTNLLFFLGLFKILPSAVDYGTLPLYLAWFGYVWLVKYSGAEGTLRMKPTY